MSLADGEYDLDLSGLLEPSNAESYALRYGFIPDSMDQSKSLRLYQDEKNCLLKAQSAINENKVIIFEGIPEKSRKNGGVMQDSYFISFVPKGDTSSMKLRKLDNTIRFTKSRNVQKLEQDIRRWDEELKNGASNSGFRTDKDNDNDKNKGKGESKNKDKGELKKKGTSSRPGKGGSSIKRLPVESRKVETMEDSAIIGESDFDDLNDDENDYTKTTSNNNTSAISGSAVASSDANKVVQKKEKITLDKDNKGTEAREIEDDFKDLEDQLDELLEGDETGNHQTANQRESYQPDAYDRISDEDESDEENRFIGTPILINIDEGSSSEVNTKFKAYDKAKDKKPTSLRELMGDKNDYMGSSSEEE